LWLAALAKAAPSRLIGAFTAQPHVMPTGTALSASGIRLRESASSDESLGNSAGQRARRAGRLVASAVLGDSWRPRHNAGWCRWPFKVASDRPCARADGARQGRPLAFYLNGHGTPSRYADAPIRRADPMRSRRVATLCLPLALALFSACAGSGGARPPAGVRTVGWDHGYSVSYVDVVPRPRSELAAGERVVFSVTVGYRLARAARGEVSLVFQDAAGGSLTGTRRQVSAQVARGEGQVTLTDTITIPVGVRTVHLFIPLVPEGMNVTSGELLIAYPVRRAP
jgi:hypothetical protein